MCLSPLTISNKAVHPSVFSSPITYTVPCGKCDECRSAYQNEWRMRLSFELDALYRRGGTAVFLTFTYNDENLPRFDVEVKKEDFPQIPYDFTYKQVCFDKRHVLQTLNRIKVSANYYWGKDSYKYFWCSEYGSDTKRPHYHCLFLLEPCITNFSDFVEMCRGKWEYGFMFPRYDSRRGIYIDNQRLECTPVLRDRTAGSKYISKYCTKDLSYYEIPYLSAYLKHKKNREKMRPFLPKHWQSNKMGFGIFSEIDFDNQSEVKRILKDGITNPLTKEVEPLPSYAINKMLYKNVSSEKNGQPRYGDKGNVLYDRFLTPFGHTYFRHIFNEKVKRTCDKIYRTFSLYKQDDNEDFSKFSDIFGELGINPENSYSLRPLALYHLVYRGYSDYPILRLISDNNLSSFEDLFSNDVAYLIYYEDKDTYFKMNMPKQYRVLPPLQHTYVDKHFKLYKLLDDAYISYSIAIAKDNAAVYKLRGEEIHQYRRKYKCRYDKKLC